MNEGGGGEGVSGERDSLLTISSGVTLCLCRM